MIKENLLKRQQKYQSELDGISKRLSNKSFVERAPKNIVDQEKNNYSNLKKDIDCFSTSSTELFSLASSYSAKEYLLAVVAEKLLFLLNFNSLF